MTLNCNETLETIHHQLNQSLALNEALNNTLNLDSTGQIALLIRNKKPIGSVDITLSFLSFAGLTMDSVFLSLHLIAFLKDPRRKTLPEKNVASFCLALFVNHCMFLIGQVFRGLVCSITSVFAFYCFMASIFWLLTMSFDVWRSIRAARRLRLNEDGEQKKFIVYSLCSWSAPGICTIIPLTVQMLPEGYVNERFRPDLVDTMCWMKPSDAMQLYFGLPVATVMLANFLLCLDTSRLLAENKREMRLGKVALCRVNGKSTHTRKNNKKSFTDSHLNTRRFMQLTFQMGLIWIAAAMSSSISEINKVIGWYVSIIFASSQGIFIFCVFTCKKEVLMAIAHRATNCQRSFFIRRKSSAIKLSPCNNTRIESEGTTSRSYDSPKNS